MPKLAGAIGYRNKALQEHEKPWHWPQSRRQIDAPFARLLFGINAIASLRLDETLHSGDNAIAPGHAAQIDGRGAADFQWPKRIERRPGRPQARLNGDDSGIRAVKSDLGRDFALAKASVGLPWWGVLTRS
jgi:hypothetical protein